MKRTRLSRRPLIHHMIIELGEGTIAVRDKVLPFVGILLDEPESFFVKVVLGRKLVTLQGHTSFLGYVFESVDLVLIFS